MLSETLAAMFKATLIDWPDEFCAPVEIVSLRV